MKYKFALLIPIILCFSSSAYSQSYTEKRIFRKTYEVNRDMTFELNNKYGSVHITTWKNDSISIRAEIEASSSDRDRIGKMFQGIDVNMSSTSFLVRAETEFSQNINMLFEEFKGLTKKIIPYESNIQINYFINAPEYLNMRITNKYGDVYMENNAGKFSLNLSNGSFEAGSLNDAGDIALTFCDATIKKIRSGAVNASFSEIEIDESSDLSVTSISSRLDLPRAGRLDVKSRRDKYYIGTVNSLTGNSYFTAFRVDLADKEINLETNYGSLDISRLVKNLELVTLNSSYTDIEIKFDPEVSYSLDIRTSHSFLVLPEENSKIEKRTINEEKAEYVTTGSVGKGNTRTKVIINATRGNIYLK